MIAREIERPAQTYGRRGPQLHPLLGGYGDEQRSRIGASLIRHRLAADLTQRELAARIGVSHRSIQQWETDRAWPSVHKFALAAAALGTTMDALWRGREETTA